VNNYLAQKSLNIRSSTSGVVPTSRPALRPSQLKGQNSGEGFCHISQNLTSAASALQGPPVPRLIAASGAPLHAAREHGILYAGHQQSPFTCF
jgi:hypothetical protein